jgi:hypothetical protein
VPAGATTGPVTVRTAAASAASSSTFTVLATPSLASFSPASGGVGSAVMITGSGLADATGVSFGASAASFTVVDGRTLTATVPVGAASGPISVVAPGGTATSGSDFVVTGDAPTLTLPSDADAFVAANRERSAYGVARTLNLNGKPAKNILVRFTVAGIGPGTVANATLRLYCVHGSRGGGHVYPVRDDRWNEGRVDWTRAPSGAKDALGALGRVRSHRWYEVNVSSVVTKDGTYTFRLRSPIATRTRYMARDGDASTQPQLVIALA